MEGDLFRLRELFLIEVYFYEFNLEFIYLFFKIFYVSFSYIIMEGVYCLYYVVFDGSWVCDIEFR